MAFAHGVKGGPPGRSTAILDVCRLRGAGTLFLGTSVRSATAAHTPLRSGLPSAVRGVGAPRSGRPSAVLGVVGNGIRSHWAETWQHNPVMTSAPTVTSVLIAVPRQVETVISF